MKLPGKLCCLALIASSGVIAQSLTAPGPSSAPGITPPASDPDPHWLSPTEQLNRKLPPWIKLEFVYRARLEDAGHIRFTPTTDTYLLSRLRLKVNLAPTRWWKIVAESTDTRVFLNNHVGNVPPYQNTWDIWQAYTQIGGDEGFASVRAGRQMMDYGDQRIIGESDWLNQGRTFDAVRLDLRRSTWQISLFSASVVVVRDGVLDHHIQGNNIYGVYSSFKNVIPKATVEPYVLWRLAPARIKLVENAGRGALDEVILGLRVAGKLPSSFDYGMELNRELGSLGPDSIRAWAGYWSLGRNFDTVAAKPRIWLETQYASGTKDPLSRTWGTFDQVYPSAHDKFDVADQVGRRNIESFRAGSIQNFGPKWTLKETFESFWLASARDALYNSSGAPIAQSLSGTAGRHLGEEFDVVAGYRVAGAIASGFGYGHLFTGEFINRLTPGRDYNYPFAYVTYKF